MVEKNGNEKNCKQKKNLHIFLGLINFHFGPNFFYFVELKKRNKNYF